MGKQEAAWIGAGLPGSVVTAHAACYTSRMSPTASSLHKRAHGQFFTEGNPFVFTPFRRWFSTIPAVEEATVLEPFAGGNHLVRLMRQAGFVQPWSCFDIDPPAPQAFGVSVFAQDTLRAFPEGFEIVITNPPYLARNSAARRGIAYPATEWDDLYKLALSKALACTPYVAAIIPESFIVSGQFRDRLHATVSLTSPMFADTQCPVCLALFVPADQKNGSIDFQLWDGDDYLGNYEHFAQVLAPVPPRHANAWKFNDPQGTIGLRGVDGTRHASVCFVAGASIDPHAIKPSSRAISRISGLPEGVDADRFIAHANRALTAYRQSTHDALMTPFKGLRSDGKYRRRLDFAAARNLLDHCLLEYQSANQVDTD